MSDLPSLKSKLVLGTLRTGKGFFSRVGDTLMQSVHIPDHVIAELPLGGLFFPLWVRREECLEARITTQMRDLDEAKAEAGLAALRVLARRVGYGEVFVDKWVDYCMIEGEFFAVSMTGEWRTEIGKPAT